MATPKYFAPTKNLDDYVEWLNRLEWVKASGRPYSVVEVDNERKIHR